ncbi:MAG TPA: 2OG-Fe(II) oxygenase [Methylomirabilota bacterium]|nr:2OG-Fe(II) oxygenase [Methylomirabilota bacterium]
MTVTERVAALDWDALERSLWSWGYAKTPPLLTSDECATLVTLYADDSRFRSHIDMARYRFGVGDYKYFAEPLPPIVAELRLRFYPPLAAVANGWEQALGSRRRYPPDLEGLKVQCRRAGQTKPTPLLLHYEAGGYNCLHQDLYGDVAFPLQLTCFLSRPGSDYHGGEFLLVEQRPRAQSRGEAITTAQGEIVIFATRHRPAAGARGYHRVVMRHGVSRVHAGSRYTLGIIFHDAR